jgi:hypothetical protein
MQKAHKDGILAFDILDRNQKSMDFLFKVAQGHVGHMAATEFKSFIETDYQALDANVILNKWDDDVAKRLEAVVTSNRIPELANYNTIKNQQASRENELRVQEKAVATVREVLDKQLAELAGWSVLQKGVGVIHNHEPSRKHGPRAAASGSNRHDYPHELPEEGRCKQLVPGHAEKNG